MRAVPAPSRASLPLLAALVGCGGTSRTPTAPLDEPAAASAFPSADELARLAGESAPPLRTAAIDVPTWELAGPFPERIDRVAATEIAPWSGLLADAVRRGTLTTTADLQCVARELGRFYLAHAAQPTETLHRYVEGWCGTAATGTDVLFLAGDAPADLADDAVFAGWKQDAARLIANVAGGGNALAGIWFGRSDGRAVLAVARGVPRVDLETTSLTPPADGVIVLRGALLAPATRLRVLVNHGELAVTECTLDAASALPRFEARCPVDPADRTAWIEVSAVPPGRLLGKVVLRVLARRGDASRSYAVAADPASAGGAAGGDDAATLAGRANQARHRAGLPPLALAEAEGAVATALTPHFFAAMLDGDPALRTDRIALGLMAGWDVAAPVRDAGFFSSWGHAVGGDHLVATALDSPMGRSVLLDPHATHLAVGSVRDASSGVTGALFVTYETLAGDAAQATRSVTDRITAARTERGLPPLRALADTEGRAAQVTERLRTGEVMPSDAMGSLIAYASRVGGGSPSGWMADAADLESLTLPEGAFSAGDGPALIVAAPYRPAGEPWWRWAVIVVTE